MANEEWKSIPGFGGHYEASSDGRIRAKDRIVRRKHSTGGMVDFHYRGRLLKLTPDGECGHLYVSIGVDGVNYKVAAHRLVLLAFVGPAPDGMEACHNNGVGSDNRASNLRWDTHYENNRDRVRHGTYARGEQHPMAKLTREQVEAMRASGVHYEDAVALYGISRSQAYRILRGQAW